MPTSGGIYFLIPSYRAVAGQTIRTEQHNPVLEDIAQALTERMPRNGTAPMVGALNMNGFRVTGLAAPIADNDAARKADISGPATEETSGVVELATAAETITGTNATRAVHPAGLAAAIVDKFDDAALTGIPTAPTPAVGDDSTKIATTAFVHDEVPALMNASGAAPMFACRAWVEFGWNGSSVVIHASGNVASVVRSSTGIYVITFTVAMPDDDYSIQANGAWTASGQFQQVAGELPGTRTDISCRVATGYPGKPGQTDGQYADAARVGVAIFR